MAFSSPLCAIVNSENLLAMLSMCLNLPFSANTTTVNQIAKNTLTLPICRNSMCIMNKFMYHQADNTWITTKGLPLSLFFP